MTTCSTCGHSAVSHDLETNCCWSKPGSGTRCDCGHFEAQASPAREADACRYCGMPFVECEDLDGSCCDDCLGGGHL